MVLKRLLPAYRNDGAHVKHFVDEAKIAVRLQHRNIVRTYRCFKAGADYLMVQELVPGRTLAYFLELLREAGTPMPLPAACYIGWCLLDALGYLHGGIGATPPLPLLHRDVNPSNVLLSVSGEVKLTDFGIAEFAGRPRAEPGCAPRHGGLHEPGAGAGRQTSTSGAISTRWGSSSGSWWPTGGCSDMASELRSAPPGARRAGAAAGHGARRRPRLPGPGGAPGHLRRPRPPLPDRGRLRPGAPARRPAQRLAADASRRSIRCWGSDRAQFRAGGGGGASWGSVSRAGGGFSRVIRTRPSRGPCLEATVNCQPS